jgi:hypothetical protein
MHLQFCSQYFEVIKLNISSCNKTFIFTWSIVASFEYIEDTKSICFVNIYPNSHFHKQCPPNCHAHLIHDRMFHYTVIYVPLENLLLIWWRHYYLLKKAAEFRSMAGEKIYLFVQISYAHWCHLLPMVKFPYERNIITKDAISPIILFPFLFLFVLSICLLLFIFVAHILFKMQCITIFVYEKLHEKRIHFSISCLIFTIFSLSVMINFIS